MRLNPRGCGKWIKPLLFEERRTLFVKDVIVAVDIAQITSCTHNVMPGCAFAGQQAGYIAERAPKLGAKVTDVDALTTLIDRGRAGDEQDDEAIQVNSHAAGKRTWLGIFKCLAENAVIRDGSLLDWRVRHGLQNISQQIHGAGPDGKFIAQECAAEMVQAKSSAIGRY